ncbi:Protein FAF1 [Beauveria bassiana D1-5]|uniref:Protein FAF1 n=1 Tax=Beauveria bassiana D1-5 TaxID=1245745 RepID=A0A0A2WBF0_BEABA|nr:Protein FAF1 [Beauveria bassiana D1-5]
MAVLGKRKSRNEAPSDGVSELDAEAIFRRHFEAQFEPLGDEDEAARAQREQDDDDAVDSDLNGGCDDEDDGDGNEWGGLSSDEEEQGDGAEEYEDEDEDEAPTVQVIDHSKPQVPKEPKMSKKELKAFMSSKVIDHTAPRTTTTTDTPSSSSSAKPAKALPEDAPSLIAQDLELRRLLSESHLLTPSHNNAASRSVFSSSVVGGDSSSSSSSEPKVFASGRTRQKTTDLRLQALGAKTSVLKQEKMPMNMRKGIVAAARMREERRRREAKENGIILERSGSGSGSGKKKGSRARQERGVHGPGIGRMRGAELRISEGDVRRIEGSRDTFGRRGRR